MPGIVLAVLSLPWCCEPFILKNNGIKECVGTLWVFPQEWGSLSTLGRSRHHHHPCRSRSAVCGNWPVPSGNAVSLSVADLFWAGFWAVVGCGAWGFNAVECGKQRGLRTGYFNGIEGTQSGLSAQFCRNPYPGSWEGCGEKGWNLFLQYVTARSWVPGPYNPKAPLEKGEEGGVCPTPGEAAALQASISFAGRHSWALRHCSDNVLSHKDSLAMGQ